MCGVCERCKVAHSSQLPNRFFIFLNFVIILTSQDSSARSVYQCLPMESKDSFQSVDVLSDESDPPPQRKPKRKRAQSDQKFARQPVSDEQRVRAMLGKPGCHCKQRCLAQFTDRASFAELMSFRSQWAALHKLDQDTEVPLLGFVFVSK